MLDRDKEAVKSAPRITEYLNETSKNYFAEVKQHLDDLEIPYVEDPNLVRGLDYYTHTVGADLTASLSLSTLQSKILIGFVCNLD